jgi:hypothetical protein
MTCEGKPYFLIFLFSHAVDIYVWIHAFKSKEARLWEIMSWNDLYDDTSSENKWLIY